MERYLLIAVAMFIGGALVGVGLHGDMVSDHCTKGGVLIIKSMPWRCAPMTAGVYQPGRE